jgi:hypothetical protein
MTFYWPNKPQPGERDQATPLRIAAALAHAELAPREDLEPLIDLLVDPVADVRQIGVRALVAMGGREGKLLARLKARLGDHNPSVMDECFCGMLEGEDGARNLSFVADFIDSHDSRVGFAAALAIAESRHKKPAFDIILTHWHQAVDPGFRADLLTALAMLKNEQAFRFLLGLIEAKGESAEDALADLAVHRSNPAVRARIEDVVQRIGDTNLRRLFAAKFTKA